MVRPDRPVRHHGRRGDLAHGGDRHPGHRVRCHAAARAAPGRRAGLSCLAAAAVGVAAAPGYARCRPLSARLSGETGAAAGILLLSAYLATGASRGAAHASYAGTVTSTHELAPEGRRMLRLEA